MINYEWFYKFLKLSARALSRAYYLHVWPLARKRLIIVPPSMGLMHGNPLAGYPRRAYCLASEYKAYAWRPAGRLLEKGICDATKYISMEIRWPPA